MEGKQSSRARDPREPKLLALMSKATTSTLLQIGTRLLVSQWRLKRDAFLEVSSKSPIVEGALWMLPEDSNLQGEVEDLCGLSGHATMLQDQR